MQGHLTILNGYDTNESLEKDFLKAEVSLKEVGNPLNYFSPFTENVQDAVLKVFYTDKQSISKEKMIELYESEAASVIAMLMDSNLKAVRFRNPLCNLHQKSRRIFMSLVCKQVALGKNVTILTQDDIIFDTMLLCVKRGLISKDDVTVWFYGNNNVAREEVKVVETGGVEFQPRGFLDETEDILFELMGAST